MSKEDLEPKLAQLMNDIPEVEGIIAFDQSGKVISGQTIEEMDKGKIAKAAFSLITNLKNFGDSIAKGSVQDITLSMDSGFAVISFGSSYSIVSFVGMDGKSQLALLARTLRNVLA